jgi:CheY-like chemotaxis protein
MKTKPKILLAEDNAGMRLLLSLVLDKTVYDMHHVENGEDAVSFVKDNPGTDLVILDLRMPKASGTRFLEERTRDDQVKKAKVLILSGDTSIEDVAKKYGIEDFVVKGGAPDELLKAVHRLVPCPA